MPLYVNYTKGMHSVLAHLPIFKAANQETTPCLYAWDISNEKNQKENQPID